MLIIGSLALQQYTNINREPYDTDILATKQEVSDFIQKNMDDIAYFKSSSEDSWFVRLKNGQRYEFHLIKAGSSLEEYVKYDEGREFASPEVLYSIKLGHIHFPLGTRKFDKHIKDLHLLGELMGKVDKLHSLTKLHFANTEERLGRLRTPSLMKSTKNFFDQSEGFVKSWFVHDDIHGVMAHNERPMYESMQPDPTSAACSKAMWNDFTLQQKMFCVLEEAYVIALERKIIPMMYGGAKMWDTEAAFKWALMRICTNLCSGWFRRFATDYYTEILEMHNKDYADQFFEAIDAGKLEQIPSTVAV